MAIISHGPAPEDHYSLVSNDLARDPGISLQAKGLYLYLRSHREGWSMSTERIADALGIHRNTVSKYVQEIEKAGFLIRDYSHSSSGTFDGMKYVLLSQPLHKNTDNGVLSHAVFTGRGKSVQHKKTNSFKKTTSSKEDQNPKTKFGAEFDTFWKSYPRKAGKQKAQSKFVEQISDGASPDDLVKASVNFRAETERQQTETRYIPYPSTFLNQERWRDYISEKNTKDDERRKAWELLDAL